MCVGVWEFVSVYVCMRMCVCEKEGGRVYIGICKCVRVCLSLSLYTCNRVREGEGA
jgi:hypothetical protein